MQNIKSDVFSCFSDQNILKTCKNQTKVNVVDFLDKVILSRETGIHKKTIRFGTDFTSKIYYICFNFKF